MLSAHTSSGRDQQQTQLDYTFVSCIHPCGCVTSNSNPQLWPLSPTSDIKCFRMPSSFDCVIVSKHAAYELFSLFTMSSTIRLSSLLGWLATICATSGSVRVARHAGANVDINTRWSGKSKRFGQLGQVELMNVEDGA